MDSVLHGQHGAGSRLAQHRCIPCVNNAFSEKESNGDGCLEPEIGSRKHPWLQQIFLEGRDINAFKQFRPEQLHSSHDCIKLDAEIFAAHGIAGL
jgi:hypothetical protein